MGDEERGNWVGHRSQELRELTLELFTGELIEGGKWFVEEQNWRIEDQGTGQSYPLLHAARELPGVGMGEACEANRVEQRSDSLGAVALPSQQER